METLSSSSVMSSRSFFNAVADCEALDQTVREYAVNALAKMDVQLGKRAAKRAELRAEQVEADKPLVDAIIAALQGSNKEHPVTAPELALAFEGKYTVQKIGSVIRRQLADVVDAVDVVRERRVVKGYYLA